MVTSIGNKLVVTNGEREGERGQRTDWIVSTIIEACPLCYRRNCLDEKLGPAQGRHPEDRVFRVAWESTM